MPAKLIIGSLRLRLQGYSKPLATQRVLAYSGVVSFFILLGGGF